MDQPDMAGIRGVFAMYPSVSIPAGWTETKVIRARRNEGRKHRLVYLEFSAPANIGILCISVKAWFNEVTTVYDSMFYQNTDDRYALVSWCTRPPESFPETQYKARFGQNRVATVNEFKEILSRPFLIKLNQRPLREEWSR
jgi:hypothetical protein